MITAHSRAAFVDKCRKMTTGVQESQRILKKETSSARIKRDEEDVKKVFEVIRNWRNPFEPSAELLSISSGYVASERMKQDLLAKEKETTALAAFIEERLVKNSTGFFQTLPKLKLESFRDAQKTSVAAGDRNVIIRGDRDLFARLLVIGQSRQMDLKGLLTHVLGPLPLSLAPSDGSLAKTNKAILSKELENGVECLSNLPDLTTAVIIDAMVVLQALVRVPDRFSELADMVMTRILTEPGDATRIDFVGDQYPTNSIKNTERRMRGRDGELVIINNQQFFPRQWRKFMANGSNKTGLLKFLVGEWSEKAVYAEKIKDCTVFVTHGDNCTKLPSSNGTITACTVLELCSNQEEADTRMFLHANHASQNGHQCIAIRSSRSDTDVEVLACYHQAAIHADIVLISGTKSRTCIVGIRQVCENLGREICEVLPRLHAITGCDII